MAKRKFQWHPLFAGLLRPHIEGFYELQTELPVGDIPRQADIALLRRIGVGEPPFRGVWRHLTTWNILEYKGPTVTPREADLPALIEIGLGIARKLNAERGRDKQRALPDTETSFWYIANRLGTGFLKDAERRLARMQSYGEGFWRADAIGFTCYLVSTVDLPVDDDSLPLHILGIEPHEKVRQVGEFVLEAANRLNTYGGAFATLHPIVGKELNIMAKSKRDEFPFDLRPVVEWMGLDKFIKMVGEKRVLEEIGEKRMLKEIGEKRLLEGMEIDDILANLAPAKLRELKKRLSAQTKGGA
jgi:hypothetical protein